MGEISGGGEVSHPDPTKEYHDGLQLERQHIIKIISLNDAQAECSCGWRYSFTGALTRQQIRSEWRRHIRKWNRTNVHPKSYMCCQSAEHSEFDEYGNFRTYKPSPSDGGKA